MKAALAALRRPQAITGVALLAVLWGAAFVGPLTASYGHEEQDHSALLSPPSGEHWLGTSRLGEDLLAQCLRGLQKSLLVGVCVALVSTLLAAVVGTVAGYVGGRVDRLLMWATDALLVLPAILVVAVVSPALRGHSWVWLVLMLAAFQWMLTARVVRARTLSLRERDFVRAARFMGLGTAQVIARHLLPHMAPLLIIDCTVNVGTAVLGEAGLSYFGLGIQPPDVSLGTLLATGTGSALTYPWVFLAPVGFLVATVTAVGLLGEALRASLGEEEGHGG
ncbi:ABC transporter permease [Streptomyces sp. NPDC000070]|uniref:ABC transporter permease n=1 Tax=Streptomyces sp. NPDC000070 TaxID=3154240 RepID=UPI00331B7DE6